MCTLQTVLCTTYIIKNGQVHWFVGQQKIQPLPKCLKIYRAVKMYGWKIAII